MTVAAPSRPDLPIRDAASVLLVRQGAAGPAVLMGQRGAAAAFMPSKFVFPGGAVDPGDAALPFAAPLNQGCAARLAVGDCPPAALAGAAIRELWEETGLRLGRPGIWPGTWPAATGTDPSDWAGFAEAGLLPDASPLHFVFRAITPPGRPRRFDARFFLADAEAVCGDPDDFRRATDELSFLHWVPLAEARRLDLPFITEVVLAEVAALCAEGLHQPETVPFFDNSGPVSTFRRIGAAA
ncbi:NUDIX hydrolase [Frigidibacter mobilis]|uniref:NUDIX hydrolase n=1 Tax=Frigidibacter mobilis TaxID=1335048 RepID=A0A159Z6E9_9RHOB|nr:NUDIX hydrolase [Frigidibacter mobilis]AMY70014.1 NUDIX hydrolase [Frigidibacter mobilis]